MPSQDEEAARPTIDAKYAEIERLQSLALDGVDVVNTASRITKLRQDLRLLAAKEAAQIGENYAKAFKLNRRVVERLLTESSEMLSDAD